MFLYVLVCIYKCICLYFFCFVYIFVQMHECACIVFMIVYVCIHICKYMHLCICVSISQMWACWLSTLGLIKGPSRILKNSYNCKFTLAIDTRIIIMSEMRFVS